MVSLSNTNAPGTFTSTRSPVWRLTSGTPSDLASSVYPSWSKTWRCNPSSRSLFVVRKISVPCTLNGAAAAEPSPIDTSLLAAFMSRARVRITAGLVVACGSGDTRFGLSMMRSLPKAMARMPPNNSMACSTAESILPFRIFTMPTTGLGVSGAAARKRGTKAPAAAATRRSRRVGSVDRMLRSRMIAPVLLQGFRQPVVDAVIAIPRGIDFAVLAGALFAGEVNQLLGAAQGIVEFLRLPGEELFAFRVGDEHGASNSAGDFGERVFLYRAKDFADR